jgi:Xaa-Pro aminopeptidase
MELESIQREIRAQALDGWLFFDHHLRDPLGYRVLGIEPPRTPTRRWYYLIPAQGEPLGLVHRIEAGMLGTLPGERVLYSSWTEQVAGLRRLTAGMRRVAMQYSPQCAIPYVSMVDGGTLELVRGLGIEVASSAELIQTFEARWTPAMLESHLEAGRRVDAIRAEAFALIRERTRNGAPLQEIEVKRFVLEGFAKAGMICDDGPIVGVNANSANPHYEPTDEISSPIRRGDWVLLDMWAKLDRPGSAYYDITWTGFCGETPSDEMRNVFAVVTGGRDTGIKRVTEAVANGHPLRGFEVDDAVRGYIDSRGFGSWFTHRTGHSIGQDVHGSSANMDNLETHDERCIAPWTCFSIEPGVYLPEFGVRAEIDMFAGDGEARVTGEIQREIVLL